jgi:peptidyl-prolyl cis-trans isomerase B (cyclophilin B)
VTPKDRERAYEKRRYEEWQARLAVKQARARRARRNAVIVGSALLTVFVIGGLFLVLGQDDKSPTTATPAAGATTPAAATPSAGSGDAKNPCPAPTVKPPAKPKQFKSAPPASDAGGKTWTFKINTTCGAVSVELDGKKAPQAVSAMLLLGKSGYFDGSPCHRLVTAGIYVLQCGDPTGTGTGGPGFSYGPVENAPKDYVYPAGTVAMARSSAPDSNGSQFFIVYKESTIGDPKSGAYTVLGKLTKGMDVVQKVAAGGAAAPDATGNTAPNRPVSIVTTSVSAG